MPALEMTMQARDESRQCKRPIVLAVAQASSPHPVHRPSPLFQTLGQENEALSLSVSSLVSRVSCRCQRHPTPRVHEMQISHKRFLRERETR